MARVTGKEGTLNAGIVGDVAVVEGLTEGVDPEDNEEFTDEEPSADVERLAQAVVRGEVTDYSSSPTDLLVIEENDLESRAIDVVLLNDPEAEAGSSAGAQVEYEHPQEEPLPPVEDMIQDEPDEVEPLGPPPEEPEVPQIDPEPLPGGDEPAPEEPAPEDPAPEEPVGSAKAKKASKKDS